MRFAFAFAIAAVATCALAGTVAVFETRAPQPPVPMEPVWRAAAWPFPVDQWGAGAAFVCAPADCGVKVDVFVRPKIGYCNCATGVSDDAELERVGDTDLVSPKVQARGRGRPVTVGWMRGLGRSYAAADGEAGLALLSVAFNDDCDVVVAVATYGDGDPATVEPAVIGFLQSRPMVLWAKTELGLEFVRRDW